MNLPFRARAAPGSDPTDGYGTPGYRAYVLNMMLLVYVLNFVDRGLLAVVARPLKAEIEISDTAWGLLTGFGFALLYTTAGIPIARLAETRNRVWIMAVCLAFWSLMTAACRDRLLRHGRDARHPAREPGGRPGRRLVRPARA